MAVKRFEKPLPDGRAFFLCSILVLLTTVMLLALVTILFPRPLFNKALSTVLLDREGRLLGASIAKDGQWRFESTQELPEKYKLAVLTFEDQRFFLHRGLDAVALGRALISNVLSGRVVSGGSTLTMQVVRLSRDNPGRTVPEKIIEACLALGLELVKSKEEILRSYANNAPFGANVVGIEAASWRWFGRSSQMLSWGESALLAVLPNSPALMHPGRNRQVLKEKRNRLLYTLAAQGYIDNASLVLALAEEIPLRPRDLPQLSPHLLDLARRKAAGEDFTQLPGYGGGLHPIDRALEGRGPVFKTAIDYYQQENINEVLARHQARLEGNGINHLAALVIDLNDNKVVAWAGNRPNFQAAKLQGDEGYWNDLVLARRSTGSLLKPFLYALMLEAGELLPDQLIVDIPTRFGGFMPENNIKRYAGAVPASEALARSLNIPAVRMLRAYGIRRFYQELKTLGISSLFRQADMYGLPLIIGGAEASLWELSWLFADLANTAQNRIPFQNYPISPASAWLTAMTLTNVHRPEDEAAWEQYAHALQVAWKTGTSQGYRDAWAIGTSSRYLVGVWVGNASGQGRPDLKGSDAAAPILFEIFGVLPKSQAFKAVSDLYRINVCADSGYLAGPNCVSTKEQLVPRRAQESQVCPYCRTIHLDESELRQVSSLSYPVEKMKHKKWFVLPPALEFYYRRWNGLYKALPPLDPSLAELQSDDAQRRFSLVFPEENAQIYIPTDLDGSPGKTVFQVAHRDPQSKLYWHLDGLYLGSTLDLHSIELKPSLGEHQIVIMDEAGRSLSRRFTILSPAKNQ